MATTAAPRATRPSTAVAGVRVGADREAERPFVSFVEQLGAVRRAAASHYEDLDPRLLGIAAASGMSQGVSSEGGFLVAPEFAEQLFGAMWRTGQILSRVSRYGVKPNRSGVKIPAFDETTRADGQRLGGVKVYWSDEAVQVTPSKPKMRQLNLDPLRKLIALWYQTSELESDTPGFQDFLINAFATEMRFVMEDAIVSGVDGILGLLQSSALITVAKSGGQGAGTFLAANAVAMSGRLFASGDPSGVAWLVHADVLALIQEQWLAMGFNPGGYVPYVGGDDDAPYGRLLGRPLLPCESCPAAGTPGDAILVDLHEYLLADRSATQARSIHVQFLSDQVAFRLTWRVAGQPIWVQPVTPKNGTNTVSPIVVLAARS